MSDRALQSHPIEEIGMSGIEGAIVAHAPRSQGLVTRAREIIMRPRAAWHAVDTEPTTAAQLYLRYIVPLSAIPPIAGFIGMTVFGVSIPFSGTYRVPIGSGITSALMQYVLGLAGVYALALIIDALAPTFAGQKSQVQALKVAGYSSTASWLAGIFALIPGFRWLGVLGVYGLYLLYLGLPIVMKSPAEKAAGYTAVVIVCAIVIFMVIGTVASRFMGYPAMGLAR
jgi:Yip1-like protein